MWCVKDEAHPILSFEIWADLTEVWLWKTCYTILKGGGAGSGGESEPGRFQVSLFLPAATASYITEVKKTKKRCQKKKIYRRRNATMNNQKQTKLAGCVW